MTEEKFYKPIIYFFTIVISNIVLFISDTIEYGKVSTTWLAILTFVLVVDSITGILAARKRHIKDKQIVVSSAKGKRGILFKIATLIVILLAGALLRLLGLEAAFFLVTIMSLLAAYESFSIIGNIQTMRTGEPKVEYDAISLLLKALQIRFKKLFFTGLSTIAGEPILEEEEEDTSYPIKKVKNIEDNNQNEQI